MGALIKIALSDHSPRREKSPREKPRLLQNEIFFSTSPPLKTRICECAFGQGREDYRDRCRVPGKSDINFFASGDDAENSDDDDDDDYVF